MSALNQQFLKDLEQYWHCEVRDASSGVDLLKALSHPGHLINAEEFQECLESAIEQRNINVTDYQSVTGLDLETADQVAEDLRGLRRMMHGT
ncbi:hypothetical protein ACQ859_20730 [Roseateles chitinivorans]|uniref:hypothetical protein n=1 Tax=Roseateles chitinivorans TaxID=2917965 RepID=UPI003D6770B1